MSEALEALKLAGISELRSDAELISDLNELQEMLVTWQRVQNLVSKDTLAEYWTRHVADSLQLLQHLPAGAEHYLDFGSGGGFPALPMAIALKDTSARFTLVESNGRKVAFLRAVARKLGLAVTVVDNRIDSVVSRETGPVDVITARALASLGQLCRFSMPFWTPDTVALFPKGREHVEEIAESSARWQHDVLIFPSVVDRDGVVLKISNLRPKTG